MADVEFTLKAGKLVFEDRLLRRLADKAKYKGLGRAGALIRTIAQRSLRYGAKPARPGAPPTVYRSERFTRRGSSGAPGRATSPLRELLFFAVDRRSDSVAVGPMVFAQRKTTAYKVPAVLEGGGTVAVKRKGRLAPARVRPHPFMAPAFRLALPKLAQQFKDTFRR